MRVLYRSSNHTLFHPFFLYNIQRGVDRIFRQRQNTFSRTKILPSQQRVSANWGEATLQHTSVDEGMGNHQGPCWVSSAVGASWARACNPWRGSRFSLILCLPELTEATVLAHQTTTSASSSGAVHVSNMSNRSKTFGI